MDVSKQGYWMSAAADDMDMALKVTAEVDWLKPVETQ